jgi:hypothetical protein
VIGEAVEMEGEGEGQGGDKKICVVRFMKSGVIYV